MSATIKDIAARTGLGLATISKYLNGGNVLEKNRILIEEAVSELGFQVNGIARSLKTKQSKTIGVVIPQLDNLFMTSIIARIEKKLREHGYGVIVCDSDKSEEREKEVLEFLMNKMVDGIILMTASCSANAIEQVFARGVPLVLIDRKIEEADKRADMVLIDNYRAAYDAVSLLTENGHRNIGLLIGNRSIYTSAERRTGYIDALSAAGVQADEKHICYTDYTMQDAYRKTGELVKNHPELTAVFATNFEMTLGALLAINDMGISIPEQISLIGFDNVSLARAMRPVLTVVSQPLDQIGEKAAGLMLDRLSGKEEKTQKKKVIMLNAHIEQGASVKRITEN